MGPKVAVSHSRGTLEDFWGPPTGTAWTKGTMQHTANKFSVVLQCTQISKAIWNVLLKKPVHEKSAWIQKSDKIFVSNDVLLKRKNLLHLNRASRWTFTIGDKTQECRIFRQDSVAFCAVLHSSDSQCSAIWAWSHCKVALHWIARKLQCSATLTFKLGCKKGCTNASSLCRASAVPSLCSYLL